MGLQEYLGYLAVFLFVLALIGLFAWALKQFVSRGNTFFASKQAPRLQVMSSAGIDTRRRLLLIRRDNKEHLVMIGGPNDLVIETDIQVKKAETGEEQDG
ncbi:MAG: hypothetical protein ACRBBN_06240 [Methyloligellaceae bacterium]